MLGITSIIRLEQRLCRRGSSSSFGRELVGAQRISDGTVDVDALGSDGRVEVGTCFAFPFAAGVGRGGARWGRGDLEDGG